MGTWSKVTYNTGDCQSMIRHRKAHEPTVDVFPCSGRLVRAGHIEVVDIDSGCRGIERRAALHARDHLAQKRIILTGSVSLSELSRGGKRIEHKDRYAFPCF